MNANLFTQFKKRFEKIKKIENAEIKKASLKEKLYQLSSIISMAVGLGISLSQDRKIQMVKTNWALLKSSREKILRIGNPA